MTHREVHVIAYAVCALNVMAVTHKHRSTDRRCHITNDILLDSGACSEFGPRRSNSSVAAVVRRREPILQQHGANNIIESTATYVYRQNSLERKAYRLKRTTQLREKKDCCVVDMISYAASVSSDVSCH